MALARSKKEYSLSLSEYASWSICHASFFKFQLSTWTLVGQSRLADAQTPHTFKLLVRMHHAWCFPSPPFSGALKATLLFGFARLRLPAFFFAIVVLGDVKTVV